MCKKTTADGGFLVTLIIFHTAMVFLFLFQVLGIPRGSLKQGGEKVKEGTKADWDKYCGEHICYFCFCDSDKVET